MIKVTEVTFRFSDLNNGAESGLLAEVKPYYKYVDGTKTDELEGYRYTFYLHQRDFEKISIKVPSQKPVITPEELEKKKNIPARPVSCYCKFYWNQTHKTYCITGTADDIILEV